eukprot:1157009-Pelagomonas_calceolata.AAC.7
MPAQMALPHTVEVSPGTQITLPPYPTFEEGLAQKAYGPTYGLVSPSVSTAGAADVAAARKEAVSSEELVPFVYGPASAIRPHLDNPSGCWFMLVEDCCSTRPYASGPAKKLQTF